MVKRGSAGHRRAACVQSSRFTIGVYGNLERLYLETGTSEEKMLMTFSIQNRERNRFKWFWPQ
jgi:hypothetical protein